MSVYLRGVASLHGHTWPLYAAGVPDATVQLIDEAVLEAFSAALAAKDPLDSVEEALEAIGRRLDAKSRPTSEQRARPVEGFVSHELWSPRMPFVTHAPNELRCVEPHRLPLGLPALGPAWLADRTERRSLETALGDAALEACSKQPDGPLQCFGELVLRANSSPDLIIQTFPAAVGIAMEQGSAHSPLGPP